MTHWKDGDRNLFLVANHNESSPSVTKDFPTSILMDTTNMLGWTPTWRPTQNGHIILVLTTLLGLACPLASNTMDSTCSTFLPLIKHKNNGLMGTFMVGVHKRNVSPQTHSQNTTLNGYYIYKIIYLVDFIFSLIVTYFLIKIVVIFYDLDY
jgi:hypothetical protein